MGTIRYLTHEGILKRENNSLVYLHEGQKDTIPIHSISELYCIHEVTINAKLLELLAQNRVLIHFFNYYHTYQGSFYPMNGGLNGQTLMAQLRLFDSHRLDVAKNIVAGIAVNCDDILAHYDAHGVTALKPIRAELRNSVEKIKGAQSIQSLRAVEGMIWVRFYAASKLFLPKEFEWVRRVRRPPDSPINALISFGNTLLYCRVLNQI